MNPVSDEQNSAFPADNVNACNPGSFAMSRDCTLASVRQERGEDELSAFLSLVEYDAHYRVDQVLKQSDSERTEKVTFVADNGVEQGPLIRKYLKQGQGIGSAYAKIFQAQQQGVAFAHVPKIHALYQLKDELVVVMDFVQGETLQEVVYRKDPSPELAEEVFPQVCEAVRELHERFNPPLIHRDLKPTNLILSWGTVTLIDFGIARVYNDGSECDTARFGTRSYAPPEQFGFGQTDVRSDVYALGMLLFYCLTERTATAQDRDASFACKGVPPEFQAVIARACSFDPKNRFSSVRDLQEEFAVAVRHYQQRKGMTDSRSEDALETEGSERGFVPSGALHRAACSFARIPQGVGIAWNVLVALLWLLVVVASVTSCFWPNPEMPEAGYPLWLRLVEYFVFMIPSITCICYEASDRRRIRRRFPVLAKWPLVLEFVVVAIAVPFILAMVMSLCYSTVAL